MSLCMDYREAVCNLMAHMYEPIFREEDEDEHLKVSIILYINEKDFCSSEERGPT